MRVIVSIIFGLLAHSGIGQSPKNSSPFTIDSLLSARQTGAIGKSFPQFTALSERQTVSNEAFRGKVVLINFWFENCLPCMVEMEALNALHHQLKDQKDFLFVSFTWDKPEAIKRVREKYGLTFGILSVSEAECRRLNFENGYPTNIILDRTGTIKYLHTGGSTNKEKASAFIMTTLLSEIKSELL